MLIKLFNIKSYRSASPKIAQKPMINKLSIHHLTVIEIKSHNSMPHIQELNNRYSI